MMCKTSVLQVFALAVLQLVSSERGQLRLADSLPDGEDLDQRLRSLFSAPSDRICGGPDIRQMLTSNPSLSGILNAPWEKVMAVAEAYIQEQAARIPLLTQEIERLQAALVQAEREEAKKPMTKQQIQETITAALEAEGSFGSVQNAIDSKCGAASFKVKRSLKPPVRRGAFAASEAAFEVEAARLLQGETLADSREVYQECTTMLPGSLVGGEASYCSELCQSFADVAASKSAGAYAGGASEKIQLDMEAKRQELQAAMHQHSECKDAREVLAGFQEQLKPLKEQIKVEFSKVLDAQDALGDAEDSLEDLHEEISTRSEETVAASQVMESDGQASREAREAFEKLVATELVMKLTVKKTRGQLSTAHAKLNDALAAGKAVQEVKAMVSQTMLSMALHFREAVLVPMRNIGLDTDTVVGSYFSNDPREKESASAFKRSVQGLDNYCETVAMPAFKAAVLSKQDLTAGLSKLCQFGGVDAAVSSVDARVSQSIASVTKELEASQVLLDPYHAMKSMTREIAMRLVSEQGEPSGLHEIVSVFQETSYYRTYLSHWRANSKKGAFLKLIAKLDKVAKMLQDQKEQVTEDLKDILLKAADVKESRVAAAEKLKQAIAAKEIADVRHAEAVTLQKNQEDEARKATEQLDALRKLLEDAIRSYEVAQSQLETAFRQGTSMLQQLEELEGVGDVQPHKL